MLALISILQTCKMLIRGETETGQGLTGALSTICNFSVNLKLFQHVSLSEKDLPLNNTSKIYKMISI